MIMASTRSWSERRSAACADKVVIATKVGNRWRPDGSGWDWDPSEKYILQEVHASLRRLKTDCIDLYQLHGGTMDDPAEETVRAFERLLKDGTHPCLGDLLHPAQRGTALRGDGRERRRQLSSEMVQYSLLDRRPEEEILDHRQDRRVRGPGPRRGSSGLLAGKPAAEYLDLSASEVQISPGSPSHHLAGPART